MPISEQMRPVLPTHYYILYEPPDDQGDEALQFISQRRRIKVKGTMLREFKDKVLPLLDGRQTLTEIKSQVADTLSSVDVDAALDLLEGANLLTADVPDGKGSMPDHLAPQLNFFHELGLQPRETQRRLSGTKVSVLGLGGLGSLVATGLAAAGVGHLTLIDSLPVHKSDRLFSPVYSVDDLGCDRARTVQRAIEGRFACTSVRRVESQIETDDQLKAAIEGSDFVSCCVDPGQSALCYKLNRVCAIARIPWTTCTAGGFEGVVGPTVRPGETACFLCYTMRSVAVARDPEAEFTFYQFLDGRRADDTDRRENLGFAVGLVANLSGLEILKLLTGLGPCQTDGSILIVDFMQASLRRHLVLRNPRCPVCFPPAPR